MVSKCDALIALTRDVERECMEWKRKYEVAQMIAESRLLQLEDAQARLHHHRPPIRVTGSDIHPSIRALCILIDSPLVNPNASLIDVLKQIPRDRWYAAASTLEHCDPWDLLVDTLHKSLLFTATHDTAATPQDIERALSKLVPQASKALEDLVEAWQLRDEDALHDLFTDTSVRSLFSRGPVCMFLEALDYIDASSLPRKPGTRVFDISEGKERIPIAVVDEYGTGPPPYGEYITDYEYIQYQGSWNSVERRPSQHPHHDVARLNGGQLPYMHAKPQLAQVLPVIYECGPWCRCPMGTHCPQAVSQRGLCYRLEIFKTKRCGWGVRTLDHIPRFAFICNYYGEVFDVETFDAMEQRGRDTTYSMDMVIRPKNKAKVPDVHYVICGLKKRNVAAFFNHSCDPNCFIQPILSDHHDLDRPTIALFAAMDISPMSELTWDYGMAYVMNKFHGQCRCGAQSCIAK